MIAHSPPPPPPIGFQYRQLELSCPQLVVFNYGEEQKWKFWVGKMALYFLSRRTIMAGDELLFSMIAFGFWDRMDFHYAPKSGHVDIHKMNDISQ